VINAYANLCKFRCVASPPPNRAGFYVAKKGLIYIKEYAYVRVSSKDQQESRQVIAMEGRGIPSERIFLEKLSGKDTKRPMLQLLMNTVQQGDIVVVESISRFARNTRDLLGLVEKLTQKGIEFISLKEHIDTTTPTGRFTLTVFAAVAELERAVGFRQLFGSVDIPPVLEVVIEADGFEVLRYELVFRLDTFGDEYVWTLAPSAGVFAVVQIIPLSAEPPLEPTPAPSPPHTDTAPNLATASSWARDGIVEAVTLDIIPQSLQNHYTNNITRAEFTAIAVLIYETITDREITGRVTFNDTTDVNVQKAAYLGIITGTGNNNFSPNMQFNREQAAVIVSRLAEAIGDPFPESTPAFADNAEISSWARQQTGQAQAAGIMEGVGGNRFNPYGTFTREQSIITMLRLFNYLS